MKVEFINLGRNKVNITVTCKGVRALHKQIGQFILSPNWEMYESETPDIYVVFAGMTPVGKVKILEH